MLAVARPSRVGYGRLIAEAAEDQMSFYDDDDLEDLDARRSPLFKAVVLIVVVGLVLLIANLFFALFLR